MINHNRARSIFCACPACVFLAGCIANEQQPLACAANRWAKPGTPSAQAIAALENSRFDCQNHPTFNYFGENYGIQCERTIPYYFIAVCVQRITLVLDERKQMVTKAVTYRPACGGL